MAPFGGGIGFGVGVGIFMGVPADSVYFTGVGWGHSSWEGCWSHQGVEGVYCREIRVGLGCREVDGLWGLRGMWVSTYHFGCP